MEHEIFYQNGESILLEYSKGSITSKEFEQDSGYGIRVLKKKKLGFAYTSDKKGLRKAISEAAAASRFSQSTKFSFQEKQNYDSIKLCNRKLSEASERELSDILYLIKEGAAQYSRQVKVLVGRTNETVNIENSSGLAGSYKKASLGIYAEVIYRDGFGSAYFSSYSIPKNPESIGEKAGMLAKQMRGAKKVKSGEYTVVFEDGAFVDMLSVLMSSFSGEWKRRGMSKLILGKTMFSEMLTLYDNPLASAGSSRPFDDEGTRSKIIMLVKNGMITNLLYDREAGSKAGVEKDGSCARDGFSANPKISASNLVIGTGDYLDFEEELKEFLLVKSLHGTHTANTITGDFGIEINSAFGIKNGNMNAVRGVMVSGNIFNLFRRIVGIEKTSRIYDNIIYPRIAFGNVRVTV